MSELADERSRVLEVLSLSYRHLKPHLRQCFAFCSIFPKDYIMRRDELIQLWMANGFIPSGGQVNLHDAGCEIFNELAWRSFFQEIEEHLEGDITCKMHDLIHDLAHSIMSTECCVIEPNQLVLTVPKTVRHMFASHDSSDIAHSNVQKLPKINFLRSLILHDNSYLKIAAKQKHLRALKIRTMKISIDNLYLRHLRYLNLSWSDIVTLPESVTSLHNLQTLNLRSCSRLRMLPKGLEHLKNLIYIDIKGCCSLTCMPAGLGELSCLRILSRFIVGKDRRCYIDELKGLALGGELCIEELDNVKGFIDARSANLKMKQNLRSLNLCWRIDNNGILHENAEEVLSGLQPHSSLKKLSIRNYHGPRFSDWLMNLLVPNLVDISLANCGKCECLPPLGKLRFLKFLSIFGMDALKFIDSSFYGDGEISFPSLESLSLSDMPCLEEWTTVHGREAFPLLTSLTIAYCPKLVEIPVVQSLKRLQITKNCNVSLLTSVMHFTGLSSLVVGSFGDLTILPDGLLRNHKHLEYLMIYDNTLRSLSNLLDNLSALKRLNLKSCVELESLPAGLGRLVSLESLHLSECDRLISLPEDGLRGLASLSSLTIQNCKKLESLSNGVGYLTSLEHFVIHKCPELKSLPQSIQHLSSLSTLEIRDCSNLMSLPRGLQCLTALTYLEIVRCTHLERRCNKETGEDWPFIAHIPSVRVMPWGWEELWGQHLLMNGW